jgi:predicted nucleic acid-binding protein
VTVFVDSNIPMYLVGAEHPNKAAARSALERAIADGERLVTDAEVMQEIFHRYAAIDRRDAIGPATDALLGVVDEVFPVDADLVLAAARLLDHVHGLSARDALHVAAMRRHGVDDILTFDAGFDAIGGLRKRPA